MDMMAAGRTIDGDDNLLGVSSEKMMPIVDAVSSPPEPLLAPILLPIGSASDNAIHCMPQPATKLFPDVEARLSSATNDTYTSSPSDGSLSDAAIDALLFDLESEDVTMTENQEASSNPTVQPKVTKRKRPKDELDYLRAKVAEMQCELQQLQQINSSATLTTFGATAYSTNIFNAIANTDATSRQMLQTLWKEMAAHNQQEAVQSLVENLKLRTLLERQMRVAKKLETALLMHQQQHESKSQTDDKTVTLLSPSDRATNYSDTIIFSTLGHDFEKQLQQLDKMFLTWKDVTLSTDMTPHIRLYDQGFEIFTSQILPFALSSTHSAMWHALTRSVVKFEDSTFELYRLDGDTVCGKMTDILRSSTCETTAHTWVKLRRVVEGDRVILVSESLVDTNSPLTVRLREIGWNILTPLSDSATMMKMCARSSPDISNANSHQQQWGEQAGSIINLVIAMYRLRMQMIHLVVAHLLQDNGTYRQEVLV